MGGEPTPDSARRGGLGALQGLRGGVPAALGDKAWESLPQQLREHFTATGPAVVAEIRGRGLDLSQTPLELDEADLAGVRQPALIVTAQDSPDVLHAINRRLAALLPDAQTALVPDGHLIDPAGPAVLDFLHRQLPTKRTPI